MALQVINCGYSTNNTGEEYLKNKIIRLYKEDDETNEAILYVQPKIRDKRPNFILIDKKRGISIFEVKDWDSNFISSVNVLEVKTIKNNTFTNPAHKVRNYFNILKNTLEMSRALCNESGDLKINLCGFFVMSNMDGEEVQVFNNFFKHDFISQLTKDNLRNIKLEDLFNNKLSIPLLDHELNLIRGVINPEIKIVDTPSTINKNNKIEEYIKVLDYEQEKFAKRITEGHYIATGVPGSGKTIMLLSRALFLAKEHPDWKIKIVCYNNSLVNKLKNKIKLLKNELEYNGVNTYNIDISTFHKMATDITKMVYNHTKNYWNETLPNAALEKATEIFDALLVDEYQDFDDTWLKVCLKVCKKHNGKENIFLAGDRLQGIYDKKDISWKSLGINIVGRSILLKTTYRSGKKHINTALQFLKNDYKLEKEVNTFYEGTSDIKGQDYNEDIIFLEGEYNSISKVIQNLLYSGYKYDDILVLCKERAKIYTIYNLLPDKIKNNCSIDNNIQNNNLIITTYHSSKGLESKICILVDFDMLENKKLVYVGMTRASEHLYIHANDFDSINFAAEVKDIFEGNNENIKKYKISEDYEDMEYLL